MAPKESAPLDIEEEVYSCSRTSCPNHSIISSSLSSANRIRGGGAHHELWQGAEDGKSLNATAPSRASALAVQRACLKPEPGATTEKRRSRLQRACLLAERPWTHVIDVGANYGEMLVGVELPQAATVIALEPNPFVIPYLTRTPAGIGGWR